MAAGNAPLPEAGDSADGTGPFVINLCSSTTPMALSHPDSPELKRFSFFVSRRREDNRERFRLHMGYFSTLAEAEEWLNVIRDVYPGAWAGEAPGKKLRARAAAAALATQLPSPPAAPRSGVPAAAKPAVAARPAVATPPNIAVPTLRAATPAAPPVSRAAPAKTSVQAKAPVPAARAPSATPVQTPPIAGRRNVPAPPPASAIRTAANPPRRPGAPAVPPPAKPVATKPGAQTTMSNFREVMASLDETGETRQMRVPAGLRPPTRETAAPAARAPAPAPASVPAPAASSLSDTQVLKILENRRSEDSERAGDDAHSGISLLKPDDTGTRRALKEAVQENAPVSFAVQLYWSVQPVELDKVPPLAIFSAYTLYTVEGSREGRKWYGLRLGFFSDAISAKQVAYYVRSEFTSVAVVPVSPAEKGRASDEESRAATGAFMKKHVQEQKVEEFKLFDDDKAARESAPAPRPAAAAAPAAAPTAKGGPVKKNKPLGKVRAKESRPQKTLEETLEILGASELQMDTDRGSSLNDTGVRHLRVQVSKNTPFSKLLDRLSERVRRG